ncbi:MAG: hypothetical protein Q9219_002869 [cf. Caloplaca sp. 3 TL-2023]
MDGLVNLYDTTITDEDDALIQVFNHGSSIAHAGFLSHQKVYALSHDECLSIYDTGDSHQDDAQNLTQSFGDLRPQLQHEYIVDLVNYLVPLRPQSIWILDKLEAIRLSGAHGEDIVRSVCFGDDGNTIYTGGEDGLIKAWRASGENETASQSKDLADVDKKRKKHKTVDRDERARFKPY